MGPNDIYDHTNAAKDLNSNSSDLTNDKKKQDGEKAGITETKPADRDTPTTEPKPSPTGYGAGINVPPAQGVAPKVQPMPIPLNRASEEVTIIAKGTRIVGDISADGGLRVGGEIKGNIRVVGKLELNGKVIGDIEAEDITVSTSMVKGNVTARNSILLDKETTVVGDVSALVAELDGRIKGNMTVKERAHMKTDSVLLGNLSSGKVNIEEGAMLRGDILISDIQGSEVVVDDLDFEIEF